MISSLQNTLHYIRRHPYIALFTWGVIMISMTCLIVELPKEIVQDSPFTELIKFLVFVIFPITAAFLCLNLIIFSFNPQETKVETSKNKQKIKTHLQNNTLKKQCIKKNSSKQKERELKKKKKIAEGNKFIKDSIQKHFCTLHKKYLQTHFADDYGNITSRGWDKEVEYFLKTVILPDLSKISSDVYEAYDLSPCTWDREIYKRRLDLLTEKITKQYLTVAKKQNKIVEILPSDIKTGIEYEIYIKQLISNIGLNVLLTPITGDQGVDLIVQKDNKRIAIQCKYYSHPVGNKAVQEISAGTKFYNCNKGIVVSNNTFTTSAKQLAYNLNISLLHHSELLDVIKSI